MGANPAPCGPSKNQESVFKKKTEHAVFSCGENGSEKDREIIVDELACHIHPSDDPHPHHIAHHLGEEALVPIGLENLKRTLDSRIQHGAVPEPL